MGEETALEKLFKSMDKDGDGTVTKEVIIITVLIINTTQACFCPSMSCCIKIGPWYTYLCFYCPSFMIYTNISRNDHIIYFPGIPTYLQELDWGPGKTRLDLK